MKHKLNDENDQILDNTNVTESTEKNKRLLQLLDKSNPWPLIREGGKLGVNGVKRFFTIVFLFSITNTLLFFYAIAQLVSNGFALGKVFFLLLVLLVGVGFTIYAAYRTYEYVVIDTMRVIYENLTSFFQKICLTIVEKAASLIKSKTNLTDDQLTKALDFGKMVNEKYKKTPKFLRKGAILLLKRIPLVSMLIALKNAITSENKLEASQKLYNKIDGFISDNILGNNHTRWVCWLLPLNIVILGLIIHFQLS